MRTAFRKRVNFFHSSIFSQIPVVSIGATMWAGLAHRFHNGQKDWKPSIANDITAISTYLPFCDAMFLENECANLLTTNPVKGRIGYKTRDFFVADKRGISLLLERSRNVGNPGTSLEMVHEVYGKFWPIPFSKLKPSNLAT